MALGRPPEVLLIGPVLSSTPPRVSPLCRFTAVPILDLMLLIARQGRGRSGFLVLFTAGPDGGRKCGRSGWAVRLNFDSYSVLGLSTRQAIAYPRCIQICS